MNLICRSLEGSDGYYLVWRTSEEIKVAAQRFIQEAKTVVINVLSLPPMPQPRLEAETHPRDSSTVYGRNIKLVALVQSARDY